MELIIYHGSHYVNQCPMIWKCNFSRKGEDIKCSQERCHRKVNTAPKAIPKFDFHPPPPVFTSLPSSQIFSVLIVQIKRLGLKWCCVCGERQRRGQGMDCPGPGCGVVYCPQCWRDLDQFCYACAPCRQHDPLDSGNDTDVYYVD